MTIFLNFIRFIVIVYFILKLIKVKAQSSRVSSPADNVKSTPVNKEKDDGRPSADFCRRPFDINKTSGRASLRFEKNNDGYAVAELIADFFPEKIQIPETVDGIPVTEIRSDAFWKRGMCLKNIYLPKTVKRIGSIDGCTELKELDLTYIESIENGYPKAFHYCRSLEKVILPLCIGEMIVNSKADFLDFKSLWLRDYLDAETGLFIVRNTILGFDSNTIREKHIEKIVIPSDIEIVNVSHPYEYEGILKRLEISGNTNRLNFHIFTYADEIVLHGEKFTLFGEKYFLGNAKSCKIIFDFENTYAEVIIYPHKFFRRYKFIEECLDHNRTKNEKRNIVRSKLIEECLDYDSKGNFFRFDHYDENILNFLTSWKYKLDTACKRLMSNYRLSEKHRKMYEELVSAHSKKAARYACESDNAEQLEFLINMGYVNERNYGAALDAAQRKSSERCLNILNKMFGDKIL